MSASAKTGGVTKMAEALLRDMTDSGQVYSLHVFADKSGRDLGCVFITQDVRVIKQLEKFLEAASQKEDTLPN